MLYDAYHIGYLVFVLLCVFGGIFGIKKIKKQQSKNFTLKAFALSTLLIHISIMWVKYLQNGFAYAPENVLFPVYFCNAMMYLLVVVAFLKNKQSKAFKYLATFMAYGGIFGALITFAYPTSYLNSNNIFLWDTLKSLLSHTTLLLGSMHLFLAGYVKIEFKNAIIMFFGVIALTLYGLAINGLFAINGLNTPNAMFLVSPAVSSMPFTMGYYLGGILIIIVGIFTTIWEVVTLPKKEIWYNKFLSKIKYDNIYK